MASGDQGVWQNSTPIDQLKQAFIILVFKHYIFTFKQQQITLNLHHR